MAFLAMAEVVANAQEEHLVGQGLDDLPTAKTRIAGYATAHTPVVVGKKREGAVGRVQAVEDDGLIAPVFGAVAAQHQNIVAHGLTLFLCFSL